MRLMTRARERSVTRRTPTATGTRYTTGPQRVCGPGGFAERSFYEVGVAAVRPPDQPKMRGSERGLPEA
jgi:hypothetical protein